MPQSNEVAAAAMTVLLVAAGVVLAHIIINQLGALFMLDGQKQPGTRA